MGDSEDVSIRRMLSFTSPAYLWDALAWLGFCCATLATAALPGSAAGRGITDCNSDGTPDDEQLTSEFNYADVPGLPIPDGPPIILGVTIDVPDSFVIADLNVPVEITHTWVADLLVLVEHNDTSAILWPRICGSNDDFDAVFDDEGFPVVCASPTIGNIIPFHSLSVFDGTNAQGIWTLFVIDQSPGDTGTLDNWGLSFTANNDCNGNATPDECDIADGTSSDCGPNAIPDECEDDCDSDGTPDDCEPDCDTDGIPDDCEPDCDTDGIPDECELDCDSDGTPDDCEPDCDTDGIPDDCELDCDTDGIPDDCEPDCDTDGTPDDCAEFRLYSDTPNAPISNGSPLTTTINVPDSLIITDLDISVNVTHTWVADMIINIEHDGTTVTLWDQQCDNEDDIVATFNDEGAAVVCNGPTTGQIFPVQALAAFDDTDTLGDWTLTIEDLFGGEDGTLIEWGLQITGFEDCNGNNTPDECDPDADSDGVPDACDPCPDEPALVDPSEPAAEVTCADSIDNDCDGLTDGADPDCVSTCRCADLTENGFTNLEDFATFAGCFNRPASADGCLCSDLTANGFIDLEDFATFAGLFNQAWNGLAPPNCS